MPELIKCKTTYIILLMLFCILSSERHITQLTPFTSDRLTTVTCRPQNLFNTSIQVIEEELPSWSKNATKFLITLQTNQLRQWTFLQRSIFIYLPIKLQICILCIYYKCALSVLKCGLIPDVWWMWANEKVLCSCRVKLASISRGITH